MKSRKLEFYKNKRRADFTDESAEQIDIPVENTTIPRFSDSNY